MQDLAEPPPTPSRRQAFAFWLKLGFISFGGPVGQIALMHEELVVRRRWISERRFVHALNYCMLLPGPEAQQLATYIGWLLHRRAGGLVAGTLFVLPSLLILIMLSWVYMAYGRVPVIAGALDGIKPAVTVIVIAAASRIASRALHSVWHVGIAVGAFVAIALLRWPFPVVVLLGGMLGAIGGRWAPSAFAAEAPADTQAAASSGLALIDDTALPPPHTRFRWPRFAAGLAAGVGLWLAAIGALVVGFGTDGVLTRMAWFFTKAALVTFGGAYAVLPYVVQAAVEQFHWLTAPQMIDGLALGETTPGPLVMVVAFVAFVGGWNEAPFGSSPAALTIAGAAAALVVTFFTFLPSFAFILLGAPLIESTQGRIAFTAPLSGITAAVVGVIASLALYFAGHVLWPRGWSGGLQVSAIVIGAAAALLVFRFRIGVVPLIVICALLGVVHQLAS